MKKLGKYLALSAVAVLAGCGGNESLFGFTSFRVVNASPDAIVTNVSYAGTQLSSDLGLGESAPAASSDPLVYDSGAGTLSFTLGNSSDSSFSSSVNLVADHYVTAILAGNVESSDTDAVQLITVDTAATAVTSTLANLKIVNASTVLPSTVDVYVINTDVDIDDVSPTVEGVSRYGVTGILLRDGGSTRIVVTAEDSKTVLLDVTESFSDGTLNTVVLRNNGTDTATLLENYVAPL